LASSRFTPSLPTGFVSPGQHRRGLDGDALPVPNHGDRDRFAGVASGVGDEVVGGADGRAGHLHDLVAWPQSGRRRGRGLPVQLGLDVGDHRPVGVGNADQQEVEEQDHEGHGEVRDGTGEDDHRALVNGLGTVGSRQVLGANLLVGVHPGDPHVAAERKRLHSVVRLAPRVALAPAPRAEKPTLGGPDERAEPDEVLLHLDAIGLRRGEVAGLVDQHDRQEGDDEEEDADHDEALLRPPGSR
jgi:hypothetical protein